MKMTQPKMAFFCNLSLKIRLLIVLENDRKVSFNIASEASYIFILSGQK